jgi:hypothetical protein
VVERDGDSSIDGSTFDPTTGRATIERTLVRDGRLRRAETGTKSSTKFAFCCRVDDGV